MTPGHASTPAFNDPQYPVVCFDEACKQLFGEVRPARPPRRGSPAQVDYEYERKGVCHQLLMCEPLRGWRHVRVSARRTRKDKIPVWAVLRFLVRAPQIW